MSRILRFASLIFALAALAPAASRAGSLCGTVRDTQTNAPVAEAGIFVRTSAGAYTGIHGASDLAGAFCIHDIPQGTYDLEVRVDDHQVAYVRGVVIGVTTAVEITAGDAGLQLLRPAPNPARDRTRIAWTLPAPARVKLAIYDVRGGLVRGWSSAMLPAGAHAIEWDLRDAHRRTVAAGTYFVHLEAGGARRLRSIVRIP